MDIGIFRPPHKTDGDYVIFSDLAGLFSAFEELKSKVVTSSLNLEDNTDKDFLGRLLLGAGSAIMFLVLLAIYSREKIKAMLTSLANQPQGPSFPMQTIQTLPAQQICVRPYSGH